MYLIALYTDELLLLDNHDKSICADLSALAILLSLSEPQGPHKPTPFLEEICISLAFLLRTVSIFESNQSLFQVRR